MASPAPPPAPMAVDGPKAVLLHGEPEARYLPSMDVVSQGLHRCCESSRCLEEEEEDDDCEEEVAPPAPLPPRTPSPDHQRSLRHRPARRRHRGPHPRLTNAKFPVWEQHFVVPVAHPTANVEFVVTDNDVFGAVVIGRVIITADRLATENLNSGWGFREAAEAELGAPDPAAVHASGAQPVDCDGRAGDPQKLGVGRVYFPVWKGGMVTLYQDAHVTDRELREIGLDGGKVFEHHRCREDICHAILKAQHLIYTVGWSIYHKVRLVREPTRPLPRGGEFILGELLKYQSDEGVRVCLLVWDNGNSLGKFFLRTVRGSASMNSFCKL